MMYWHNKPNGDNFIIEFYHHEYPDIFERSFQEDTYFLSQDVKSWLVKNDIKVFVQFEVEKTLASDVKFCIKFQSASDAGEFMDEYAHWGEQKLRLKDMNR